jgi:3-oxoacyl-[acyl-carrier-protein] synthase II
VSAVVLGWGCIAAAGFGPEELERALVEPPRRAGSLAAVEDPGRHLTMRGLRPLARASRLGAVAAAAALGHPRERAGAGERTAVVVGTQWGSIEPLAEFDRAAVLEGPRLVNPAGFPNVVANVHAGYIGILFGLAGPNVTVCGRGAGLEALGQALDLLTLGRADSVLSGGVEAPGATLLHGLARRNGSAPATSGEGAAFVLLAREEEAGRPALARAAGCGARTAHGADGLPHARAGALGDALAGTDPRSIGAAWFSGERPDPGLLPGVELRTLEPVTGDCRGAGGALAAVLAARTAARERRPTLALDFPPAGTQSAAVLLPA